MTAALEAKDKVVGSLLEEIERLKTGVAVDQGGLDPKEATMVPNDCLVKQVCATGFHSSHCLIP